MRGSTDTYPPRTKWERLTGTLLPKTAPVTTNSPPIELRGGAHGGGSAAPAMLLALGLFFTGVGAFISSLDVVFGEKLLNFGISDASCIHIGAVGGAILVLPEIIVVAAVARLYFIFGAATWERIRATILFAAMWGVYIAFGALKGLVGWAILHHKEEIQLNGGKVAAVSALGSVFTAIIPLICVVCFVSMKMHSDSLAVSS